MIYILLDEGGGSVSMKGIVFPFFLGNIAYEHCWGSPDDKWREAVHDQRYRVAHHHLPVSHIPCAVIPNASSHWDNGFTCGEPDESLSKQRLGIAVRFRMGLLFTWHMTHKHSTQSYTYTRTEMYCNLGFNVTVFIVHPDMVISLCPTWRKIVLDYSCWLVGLQTWNLSSLD